MPNIRDLILSKQEKKENKRLVMKDVNRDLIVSLLAISIYGKEAREEDILSVIINAGVSDRRKEDLKRMRDAYNKMLKEKDIKKTKSGETRDREGFLVLTPRT